MRDALTDSLNAPAGRLAEVLIKKLRKGEGEKEMSEDMRARFDNLTDAPGKFGTLARVRFAAEVSLLFERAPAWTAEKSFPCSIGLRRRRPSCGMRGDILTTLARPSSSAS